MDAGLTDRLRLFILRLRCATAGNRMTAALLTLERHYRPDQPRVPAGVAEGGQWTSEGAERDISQRIAAMGPTEILWTAGRERVFLFR